MWYENAAFQPAIEDNFCIQEKEFPLVTLSYLLALGNISSWETCHPGGSYLKMMSKVIALPFICFGGPTHLQTQDTCRTESFNLESLQIV